MLSSKFFQNGIERETLRVLSTGETSSAPHPSSLGHKLTHPNITTDYSENLLEFITSVHIDPKTLLGELACIHGFSKRAINDELLWPFSMPAILPDETDIPLAYYGESNVGKLKTLYRRGLGHRYGRSMQTIAGVHFNFSFTPEFWKQSFEKTGSNSTIQEYKNEKYFHLIRNFKRYSWVLMYLFGASPMVHSSFLAGKKHDLKKFNDDTYYSEDGVSLRMGGLGYTSSAQKSIKVCFNQLDTYIKTVEAARLEPYDSYEDIGIVKNGIYEQLNTNLLQIDNEFYSTVRPKNIAKSRESALGALHERGIEYIEVRLLDVNPFSAYGIDEDQVQFLNYFLLWCLETSSEYFTAKSLDEVEENFLQVVKFGRTKNPLLKIEGKSVELNDALETFFDQLEGFYLKDHEALKYIQKQRLKVTDRSLLPSQRILDFCQENHFGFIEAGLVLARENKEQYQCHEKMKTFLNNMVAISQEEAAYIENNDKLQFEDFLKKYFSDIKI